MSTWWHKNATTHTNTHTHQIMGRIKGRKRSILFIVSISVFDHNCLSTTVCVCAFVLVCVHVFVSSKHAGQEMSDAARLLHFEWACDYQHILSTQTPSPAHMVYPAETTHAGNVQDCVQVNQRFRSSVLGTRVFFKTYLQSDHRPVVPKGKLS